MKKIRAGKCLAAAAALCLFHTGVWYAGIPVTAAEIQELSASGSCGAEGDELTWTLDTDGTLTISGTGRMGSWPPSQVTYKSTVPWAEYLKDIKAVVIEEGVTSIGMYAFYTCTNLTEITIPESVTKIELNALMQTAWMENRLAENPFLTVNQILVYVKSDEENLTVPDGVTKIGGQAFNGVSQTMKRLTLPDGVKELEASACMYCAELEQVTLPDTLTAIGSSAFYGCTGLKKINIPEGVESIAASTFNRCSALESIDLPESVAYIGYYAFAECTALTDITIRNPDCEICDGTATISNSFQHVAGQPNKYIFNGTIYSYGGSNVEAYAEKYERTFVDLNAVEIASGSCGAEGDDLTWTLNSQGWLTISGKGNMDDWKYDPETGKSTVPYAEYLADIKTVIITDGVTGIGACAFQGCEKLRSITIPESVTSFGRDAFSGTAWLEAQLEKDLLLIINHVLVVSRSIAYDVTVPKGVTKIEAYACSGNRNLTTVSIPASVRSIGQEAFSACPNLNSVILPKQLTEIGAGAFRECTALQDITIPAGITEIRSNTFAGCSSLKSISIPENVKTIGEAAFADCEQLAEITICNPDCVIFDETAGGATICNSSETSPDGETAYLFTGTIYGAAGSSAEAYAEKYGRNFTPLATMQKKGDVDCNGVVDVADAVLLARLLAEDADVYVRQAGMRNADVNGSGLPDQEDIVLILKAIARLLTL